MATDQECLDYARECVRLAGLINDVQTRNHMIYLAREWMATAMHADKMPEPTSWEGAGANIAVGLKPPLLRASL
jgi:hypothetical protein